MVGGPISKGMWGHRNGGRGPWLKWAVKKTAHFGTGGGIARVDGVRPAKARWG